MLNQHFYMTVDLASSSEMHVNALHCASLTQPLLDCILHLTQHLYEPGTLSSSAYQCIFIWEIQSIMEYDQPSKKLH